MQYNHWLKVFALVRIKIVSDSIFFTVISGYSSYLFCSTFNMRTNIIADSAVCETNLTYLQLKFNIAYLNRQELIVIFDDLSNPVGKYFPSTLLLVVN